MSLAPHKPESTPPEWAPWWAPSPTSLDYLNKLAATAFLILGVLYFLGFDGLRPFAHKHVAAV